MTHSKDQIWQRFQGRGSRGRTLRRIAMGLSMALATPLWADLARDANTARIVGEEGNWVMENALQLEKDKDGKTWTFETAIQYTPIAFPRLQLLLEPTFWEREEPKDGPAVSGLGDTDFTVAYLTIPAEGPWPAVIVAGKVKIPTADDREIGTGKADYSASLIIGKEYGELEVSLELEYETFGDPPAEQIQPEPGGAVDPDEAGGDEPLDPDEVGGDEPAADAAATTEEVELKDLFSYTLTIEYGLLENLSVFIEFFGNSAPSQDESASNAVNFGAEYDVEITDYANPFISLEADTDNLITAKAGVEWDW